MESQKPNYFENANQNHQRQFIIAHSNCVLCGTVLVLKHKLAEVTQEINEEAFCPKCEIKARNRTFTIQ